MSLLRAGTRELVAVLFAEPLDHTLLLPELRVATARGEVVEGDPEIRVAETAWAFA